MSRSDYSDDFDENWDYIRWRGRVASSIRGKRGQKLLRELAAAMDAIPGKSLVAHELVSEDGQFCALGAVGQCRGIDLTKLDPDDYAAVAEAFDIAEPLAREIVFENDEQVSEFEWVEVEIHGPIPRELWREKHLRTRRVEKDPQQVAEKRWQHMRQWVADHLTDSAKTAKLQPERTGH